MPKKRFTKIMVNVEEKVWKTEFRSSKTSSQRNIYFCIDPSFKDAFDHIMPMIWSFLSLLELSFLVFNSKLPSYIAFNQMPYLGFHLIFFIFVCFLFFFIYLFIYFLSIVFFYTVCIDEVWQDISIHFGKD